MSDTQNLYNVNDGLTGRDGGPYLDLEEQRLAEVRRARVEDRDPDLDKPGPSAGTQLVTAPQLLQHYGNVNNLPSQGNRNNTSADGMLDAVVADDNNPLQVAEVRDTKGINENPDKVDTSMQTTLKTDGKPDENKEPGDNESDNVDVRDESSDSDSSSSDASKGSSVTKPAPGDTRPPANKPPTKNSTNKKDETETNFLETDEKKP